MMKPGTEGLFVVQPLTRDWFCALAPHRTILPGLTFDALYAAGAGDSLLSRSCAVAARSSSAPPRRVRLRALVSHAWLLTAGGTAGGATGRGGAPRNALAAVAQTSNALIAMR